MEPKPLIFSNQASRALTALIAQELGVIPGKQTLTTFADGEICVAVMEAVSSRPVYIIASTQPPAEHWVEVLLLSDTLKRRGASSVTLILPYAAYNRQTNVTDDQSSHSAAVHFRSLRSYVDQVIVLGLHDEFSKVYFHDLPVEHCHSLSALAPALQPLLADTDYVFVAPDGGSHGQATAYAKHFGQTSSIACLKTRSQSNTVDTVTLPKGADLTNKLAIIVDDMIDTGGTLIKAAAACKQAGARVVWAVATHALFSNDAVKQLDESPISKILVTDSLPDVAQKIDTFKTTDVDVISVAPLLARRIKQAPASIKSEYLYTVPMEKILRRLREYQELLAFFSGIVLVFAGYHLYQGTQTQPDQYYSDEVHVHSDILVYVAGEQLDFTSDQFQSSAEQILHQNFHFHDNEDHVIHRHAADLTLAEFFDSLGFALSNTCLVTVTGTEYCDSEDDVLRLYVNGESTADIETYVPQEEDQILLYYGTPDNPTITEYLKEITDESCIYSGTCPERGIAPPESCGLSCEL